jgi:Zn-dependent peptidase ImmA (M78 family)|uniref:IrrE protein n=1 Tax=Siphoviridae sp. ctMYJ33 TaxID=2825461 RepID=A0A8S5P9B0_9CAUD|nr:MAG TPA: IrrE protein [Siphoviridae sp. ctMYJ33]
MLTYLLNNEIDEQQYLIEYNAKIIYKKLPKKVYGFVFKYRNINLVVINWNISKDKKKLTLLHEFAHIELSHLNKCEQLFEFSIENAEDEADEYIKFILS